VRVGGVGSWPREPGNQASVAESASPAVRPDLLYCLGQGLGRSRSGRGARHRRPNKSFKPTPLRGAA